MLYDLLKRAHRKYGYKLISIAELEYLRGLDADRSMTSQSQLYQDLFVLFITGAKREGYFVEFGATDGISLSNTYLLETKFNWKGILSEPAKKWHKRLRVNRHCVIDERCVWSVSGEKIEFIEAKRGEFSSIKSFIGSDMHMAARQGGISYNVETVSLKDLLDFHGAPETIDYLSMDTEGSEFEILNSFDFNSYDIKLISCEHNYTPARDKIYNIMVRNGYRRIYEELSLHDDWYVKDSLSYFDSNF